MQGNKKMKISKEVFQFNLFIICSMFVLGVFLPYTELWSNDVVRVGIGLFFVILWTVGNSHLILLDEIRRGKVHE